ncbi:MAG: glycosyltransferase family 2 protein [Candidatus Paceibacterota bacterium]|jgi:glycosyltransferase involved in cell wall biosynthesis
MNDKLSIIIPCYNCQDTLEEAVVSACQQGLTIPFELILVDDASTDKTQEVIEKLARKYPNLGHYQHEKNLGGGATRNTAVQKSTGNIIFCLDSDDLLPKGALGKMVKFLKEKECDGVTIHRSIKFSGKNIENIHHIETSPYLNKKIPFESLLSKNKGFLPLCVNFMYTKEAFAKTGGYPTLHGFDTQGFAWRFLCAGLSAYTCPEVEYLHRVNFNESYYLREYNDGKMNYNWRDIFVEHYYVFNKKALDFICTFNCRDFTRNILSELIEIGDILIPNPEKTFGRTHPPLQIKFPSPIYVPRDSLLGYYLRIKHRFKKIFTKNLNLTNSSI